MGWIADLFEKHKLIRRGGMIACANMNLLICGTAVYCWLRGVTLDPNIKEILLAVLGLNSLYIGLYQWDRMQDR